MAGSDSVAAGDLLVAPKITDDLIAASKRVGIKLDDVRIVDGVAHMKIDPIANTFSRADLNQFLDFARASGAKQVRLNTGQVVKPSITRGIERAIESGRPYLGGRPVLVREVGPSVIPGNPPIRIYDIIFDL